MNCDHKAIALGHPSYVWRFGQDRRLALIRRYAPLEGKRILDVGCGLGTYVKKMRDFSQEVWWDENAGRNYAADGYFEYTWYWSRKP